MGRDTHEASFFDRQPWFSMASLQEKAPCSKRTCTVPLYHRTTIRPIFPSTICTAAEILSTRHPRYHASSQTPLCPFAPFAPFACRVNGFRMLVGCSCFVGSGSPRVLMSSPPHVQYCVVDDDAALSHITASVATTPFPSDDDTIFRPSAQHLYLGYTAVSAADDSTRIDERTDGSLAISCAPLPWFRISRSSRIHGNPSIARVHCLGYVHRDRNARRRAMHVKRLELRTPLSSEHEQ
jgi:hypothetical protein